MKKTKLKMIFFPYKSKFFSNTFVTEKAECDIRLATRQAIIIYMDKHKYRPNFIIVHLFNYFYLQKSDDNQTTLWVSSLKIHLCSCLS